MLMRQLATDGLVKLLWVPGHFGTRGIEITDDLVRNGTVEAGVSPNAIVGVILVGEGVSQVRESIHRTPWTQNALGGCWVEGRTRWELVVGLMTGNNTLKRILTP